MRLTFGAAAAISLIVLVVSALWPEGRSGPSPRRLVAKDKPNETAPRLLPVARTRGDADQRTEANLQKRIDVDYLDTPFAEVLDDLAHNSELQFYLKAQFLEDYGISTDFPVTLSLNNVSVATVLELILEQAALTWVMRDGVLLVTTEEDSESFSEVRVYNCRDLLEATIGEQVDAGNSEQAHTIDSNTAPAPSNENKDNRATKKQKAEKKGSGKSQARRGSVSTDILGQFGGGGMGGGSGEMVVSRRPSSREVQLMNIISIAVMPESWEQVGGRGTIGEFDGMIVIRHSSRAHRQVEQVLHMLRDASAQQRWENPVGGGFGLGGPGFGSGGGGGFF